MKRTITFQILAEIISQLSSQLTVYYKTQQKITVDKPIKTSDHYILIINDKKSIEIEPRKVSLIIKHIDSPFLFNLSQGNTTQFVVSNDQDSLIGDIKYPEPPEPISISSEMYEDLPSPIFIGQSVPDSKGWYKMHWVSDGQLYETKQKLHQ